MGSTVHVLDLTGDVTLRVEDRGVGSPVVLLHGFTGDASTMEMLAIALADGHRVIVPDLIGHGGSSGANAESYSVDEIAGQLLEMLDGLGIDGAADLVGYSMGGRVALTLACTHPDRVRTLSLIGASAGLVSAEERAARVDEDEALAASIEAEGLETFVDRWTANPLFATQGRLGPDRRAGLRAQRLRNDGAELARSLRAAGTGRMRPLHDEVRACPVPTTLIAGGDDAKFLAIAESLAAVMPDAEVAGVPGIGHAAHLEDPTGVEAVIRRRITDAISVSIGDARLPLVSPLVTAAGATDTRHTLLYSLTVGPHTGWGEAAPLPGWSPETLPACRAALPRTMRKGGLDLEPVGAARTSCARAAVVGAALDVRAREQGVPLRRLLAETYGDGTALDSVEVNGVVSAPSPADVGEQVRALVDRDVTTIKIKVAAGAIDDDVARLDAARAAAPDATLRIDANGGWTPDDARAALECLAPYDVTLCEEPVPGIAGIAALAATSPIPLAVDESSHGLVDLRAVWAHASRITAVIVKPQAIGGDDFAMAAIAEARRHGVGVIVTTMIDSAVGVAHAAHVAAAARLPGAHGLDTSHLLEADVATPPPIEGGHMRLSDEPGLGIGPVSPPPLPPS